MQPSKIKTIVYWVATGILGLDLIAGGALSLLHPSEVLITLSRLGPACLASSLGGWQLLGGVALLLPGLPAWLIFGPDAERALPLTSGRRS